MKKPLAIITGIAGFAGSYLAEELLDSGYRVAGSVYPGESTENVAGIRSRLRLITLDILNQQGCKRWLSRLKPDYLFHLAAFASVGKSFEHEQLVYRVNFEGTLHILRAALAVKRLKKLVLVSSADCYGIFKPKNKTLTEDQPFNPVSPYGISKAAAEQLAMLYFRRYHLPVTIARSFNHSGPRQNEAFVIPSFARQIAIIEKRKQRPVMSVGDLSAKRDLSDVRDTVCGYRLLAEKGRPGRAYHFCSGKAVSIGSVLDRMLRLSRVSIKAKVDRTRFRKNDIPVLRGDNSRAVRELGFRIQYGLKATLEDTLNYWRDKSTL